MEIRLKRVQDPASDDDGLRFLVDRLWPRGIRKDGLRLDGWLKDLAPSTGLRKWFGHDPARWREFQQRYFAELNHQPTMMRELQSAVRQGPVTLIFAAHDVEHNNAAALRAYLIRRIDSCAL